MSNQALATDFTPADCLVPVYIDFEFQVSKPTKKVWPRELGAIILLPTGQSLSIKRQINPLDNDGKMLGNWTDGQKEFNEGRIENYKQGQTVLREFKQQIEVALAECGPQYKPLFTFHDYRGDLAALRNVAGSDEELCNFIPDACNVADTQTLHSIYNEETRRIGLGKSAYHYNIGDKQPKDYRQHDALQDARITAAVMVEETRQGAANIDPRPFVLIERTLAGIEEAINGAPEFETLDPLKLSYTIEGGKILLEHVDCDPKQMLMLRKLLRATDRAPQGEDETKAANAYLGRPNIRHTRVSTDKLLGKLIAINTHLKVSHDVSISMAPETDVYVPGLTGKDISENVSISAEPELITIDDLPAENGRNPEPAKPVETIVECLV
jgi:hypothetical protein